MTSRPGSIQRNSMWAEAHTLGLFSQRFRSAAAAWVVSGRFDVVSPTSAMALRLEGLRFQSVARALRATRNVGSTEASS